MAKCFSPHLGFCELTVFQTSGLRASNTGRWQWVVCKQQKLGQRISWRSIHCFVAVRPSSEAMCSAEFVNQVPRWMEGYLPATLVLAQTRLVVEPSNLAGVRFLAKQSDESNL